VLSSKPDERRTLFEEAAGIYKYKVRRIEAEKKLEKQRENLTRLQDILGEIESRIEPLSIEAEKTTQFLKLKETLKEVDVNIFIHEMERLDQDIAELEQKVCSVDGEIETKTAEDAKLIQDYEKIEERLENFEDEILHASIKADGQNFTAAYLHGKLCYGRTKGRSGNPLEITKVLRLVLPTELDGEKIDKEFVDSVIATLGLEHKVNSLPSQLSGGQQQRVAIARALVSKPAIILADEPTGNLDSKTSQDVISLLKVTSAKYAQTIVMITHNEEIAQMADRTLRIEDGSICVK